MSGALVQDRYGVIHVVLWRRGNTVKTVGGQYIHITKCTGMPTNGRQAPAEEGRGAGLHKIEKVKNLGGTALKTIGRSFLFAIALLLVGALGVFLTGCGGGVGAGNRDSKITIQIDDRVFEGGRSKTIMPGVDLEAAKYVVNFDNGTKNFDLTIIAPATSGDIDLIAGTWTCVAHVINGDDQEVGATLAPVVKQILEGQNDTIQLDCYPIEGVGSFQATTG